MSHSIANERIKVTINWRCRAYQRFKDPIKELIEHHDHFERSEPRDFKEK